MKKLNFLTFFYGIMLVMFGVAFVGCTDDDDDTEAPFLKVDPTTLVFGTDGQPVEGSQSSFTIKTNRSWRAVVNGDKSWLTLSATQGEGDATVEVSIPQGTNDEAKVVIELYNKIGPLSLSETVTIKAGGSVTSEIIYNETVGDKSVSSPYPYVADYDAWQTTGIGAANVTYAGQSASVRASGKASGGYDGASGPNVIFFGTLPAYFQVKNIALTAEQTNLKLTFGASYSLKVGTDYVNTFDPALFNVALSADGTNWTPITYTKNNGDQADPFWVFATSDFTLKEATQSLYIQFTALAASAIRLDDITLSTGMGGTIIDLGSGTTAPTVTTADATGITATSAILGGSAQNISIAEMSAAGVQYVEFSTGTVSDIDWSTATKAAATSTINPWTVTVSSLTTGSQYAYRAYATTATGDVVGEPKTFVAQESTATAISIPNLIAKMTATATLIDNDYTIQGVICSDPAGKNYSYGTLYIMTKGATTGGNALTLYNTAIDVTQYSLGQEVKVTLNNGVAKIYKRNDVPQIEGVPAGNIEVISSGNTVTPIKISVSDIPSFIAMPITIEDATTAVSGVWNTTGVMGDHPFSAAGGNFNVNINKGAIPFNDQAFVAGTASITGIATVYKGNNQIMPRNLNDVKNFSSTTPGEPTITAVNPTAVSFQSAGGSKDVIVTVSNLGSNQITATGLSGILSATVSGTTVTVASTANTAAGDVKQTLKVAVGASYIDIPVTVFGTSSPTDKVITLTADEIATFPSSGSSYTEYSYDNTFGTWSMSSLINSTGDGGPYLQLNFKSSGTSTAKNSHIQIPNVNGIIQKIEITGAAKMYATESSPRYLLACEAGYTYADNSTQGELNDAAKARSNSTTTSGECLFTFDNMNGLNLSELSIFPGGGAVYISSITVTYK